MKRLRLLILVGLVVGLVALSGLVLVVGDQTVALLLKALILAGVVVLALWLIAWTMRRFLWRVGRRLAFSYFLIGVLPIPMVLFLLYVGAVLMSGVFLGHLYRDGVAELHRQLASQAKASLEAWVGGTRLDVQESSGIAVAYYRDGSRVSGDDRFPQQFPAWLTRVGPEAAPGAPQFVTLEDGSATMAVARDAGRRGLVAMLEGDLEAALSGRSGIQARLVREQEDRDQSAIQLQILGQRFALRFFEQQRSEEILGFEVAGPFFSLSDGEIIVKQLPVSLTATPQTVYQHLFSGSGEVHTAAWLFFIVPAFLLFDIYVVAALMALYMIFGLSRAVNRMSRATAAVQAGDFSVRIPVRRRDQVGELQRSFNQMAENLEQLVTTATQKEILERELELARDLQRSLLPSEVIQGDTVEFAAFCEPCAAIGGDYFDVLQLDPQRVAVVIADVAGHGLSAGLRMAMVKAALHILVEEGKDTEEILHRLDGLLRSGGEEHCFVTLTLAFFDTASGSMELVNAGHPPTYLLSGGEVEEIMLPGSPLGALSHRYGRRNFELKPESLVVWLSDGIIEAVNIRGEPFGYERAREALRGPVLGAAAVRDHLLEAVGDYTGHRPAEDDRTLVVMRYRPGTLQ